MRLKRKQLILPAIAGLCVFTGLDLSGALSGDKSIAAAVGKMLGDPLSLFGERSPGGRDGVLIQTKQRFASAEHLAPGPSERVLSQVRAPEAPYVPQAPILTEAPVFAVPTAFKGIGPMGDGDFGPGPQSPPGGPFIPPNFSRGGRSGGGGPTIPDEPKPPIVPPIDPPPVSGIPEPATWVQLNIGMFAVGAMLRRNARRRVKQAAGARRAS